MHVVITVATAAALLLNVAASRALPVSDSDLKKVKQVLRRTLAVHKQRLAADTTEAELCRSSAEELKGKLKRQGKVVDAKLKDLNDRKAEQQKYLDQLLAEQKQRLEEMDREQ